MPDCDLCADTGTLQLFAVCHPTVPLRVELREDGVMVLYCYRPDCNREVARFKAEEFVPNEFICPNCGLRRGTQATDGRPSCLRCGTAVVPLSWRLAAAEAGEIAAGWMKRAKQLEDAFPSDAAMPVDERDSVEL